MAFKKWQVWNKQLWKYVPTMVVEPRQSFDPTENDEIKKIFESFGVEYLPPIAKTQ